MCNANTSPDIYTDYFYWDGSRAVFYGEFFGAYYLSSYFGDPELFGEYWWDDPTSDWYKLPLPEEPEPNVWPTASAAVTCSGSSCHFDGGASSDSDGTIVSYDWAFGDGTSASGVAVEHTYAEPGSYTATLTVTDDQGGWARDSKLVSIAPPPPPNAAPTASFGVSCAGLSCTLDGGGSADGDGTIVQYRWEFGDGGTGSGRTVPHSYTQAGSYTVKLTVTDDDGATGTASKAIALIRLTARGYKLKGLQAVDLSWNGAGGTSYDVYRDGQRIVGSISGSSYSDNLNRKGSGSYGYKVCDTAGSICSNQAAVSF
jgi:predicted CxxxxCH...CXXCH cytochrome family protein